MRSSRTTRAGLHRRGLSPRWPRGELPVTRAAQGGAHPRRRRTAARPARRTGGRICSLDAGRRSSADADLSDDRRLPLRHGVRRAAVRLHADVEGKPAGEIAKKVMAALDWLQTQPEHRAFALQLQMVALNLKNLK